ncbi:PREDICTED: uncharacterized protein LOC104748400 [Camelina sativa]|uniref:Uncharacterized protein LOC104748400 n=1 Tax=Camelina sativa TaxID=90675 RepID=A0ABM0WB03_CAMSA|nr:PREDICTED: uncharacterized protein LOC104748400 [Camelina sativa]
MAVKTDMSKAYDRLEWDFIKEDMERMGFHQTWIQWIMQCINIVEYSSLLNGQARGSVTPERGIRQGDPLSPYLFIICSEVLSGLCSKAQSQGNSIPLWTSLWLTTPMGPPTAETHTWSVADLLTPCTSSWNIYHLNRVLPAYKDDILKLKPSKKGAPDKWAWLPSSDGQYTTKAGYNASQSYKQCPPPSGSSLHPDSFSWEKNIWSIKASQKVKLLMWKILQQAIPVGSNLTHHNISGNVNCLHCTGIESELHLFFTCPFATKVCDLAPFSTAFVPQLITSTSEGIKTVNQLVCLPPTGVGGGPLTPWILWVLWTSRNKLLFNKEQILPEDALHLATIGAKEWQEAQSKKATNPPPVKIPLPPSGIYQSNNMVTCFTDASWITAPKAGLGWVFKDRNDHILLQGSDLVDHVHSPLMAEAAATLTAVEVAIASGFTHISFASDSQLLVKALNAKFHSKDIHGILHDILDLSICFSVCNLFFIPQNQNLIADNLATQARSSTLPLV